MPRTHVSADAFVRRIIADPADPLPRLVFADWLEESGDPADAAWAHYLRARAGAADATSERDRTLFRNATLVLEVAARRPLTEIQSQFPHLFKVGPNTKMNEIVHAHLPGVNLIHLPTPPPQIRAITDHVYFYLDRTSPLWPEFSTASSVGMHFSGDWPELQLEFWAVLEGRR